MMPKWRTLLTLVMALAFVGSTATFLESQSAPRMSVEELNGRLGEEGLVIVDVRSGYDWSRSDVKIAGAVREAPNTLDWAQKYSRDSTLVLYCT